MPRVPDASSVTRLLAIQSSAVLDPVKRSASYTPAQPMLLYSLRASDAGRGMFPGQSCLSTPVTCGYVNPRQQGYITRTAPPLPRISLNLEAVDFDENNKRYEFGETTYPPAADFEAVIFDDPEEGPPSNVDQISYIAIFDFSGDELALFANTTISTSPAWTGATFTSSETRPSLSTAADAGTFPGLATVLTFRNVPVIANLAIQFGGNTYEP
jgi:hypothetical protein